MDKKFKLIFKKFTFWGGGRVKAIIGKVGKTVNLHAFPNTWVKDNTKNLVSSIFFFTLATNSHLTKYWILLEISPKIWRRKKEEKILKFIKKKFQYHTNCWITGFVFFRGRRWFNSLYVTQNKKRNLKKKKTRHNYSTVINRRGVAGAVLWTASWFINSLSQSAFSSKSS